MLVQGCINRAVVLAQNSFPIAIYPRPLPRKGAGERLYCSYGAMLF